MKQTKTLTWQSLHSCCCLFTTYLVESAQLLLSLHHLPGGVCTAVAVTSPLTWRSLHSCCQHICAVCLLLTWRNRPSLACPMAWKPATTSERSRPAGVPAAPPSGRATPTAKVHQSYGRQQPAMAFRWCTLNNNNNNNNNNNGKLAPPTSAEPKALTKMTLHNRKQQPQRYSQ